MKYFFITLIFTLLISFASCKQEEKTSKVDEAKPDTSQVSQDTSAVE